MMLKYVMIMLFDSGTKFNFKKHYYFDDTFK